MAELLGRAIKWKKNAVTIAGVQDIQFTHNAESVDVTTQDDSGIRKLLKEAAELSSDVSISGLVKDDVLANLYFDNGTNQMYTDMTFEWDDGREIAGDMFLSSLTFGAPYKDKVTFSATVQLSGAITLTKAV